MLAIVLKILSILGIVLLALLCAALAVLLLVLFFPITYRLQGKKDGESMSAQADARWLFGFLRVRAAYPGAVTPVVKILWFRLQGRKAAGAGEPDGEKHSRKSGQGDDTEAADKGQSERPAEQAAVNDKNDREKCEEPVLLESEDTADGEAAEDAGRKSIAGRISAKYHKIKYTILNIYDKIKHILENISFYKELLTDEDTKKLFGHACFRLGKVLKSIRPRKIKANVRFGAASPDTTGYLYGVYGMLYPKFGKDICVVPDFEQAVLEGELYAAGHITVFRLVTNGISLLLDRSLRKFLRRLRAHGASQK